MSWVGTARRSSRRNTRESSRIKMTRVIDLNSPPVEAVSEGASASGAVSGGIQNWTAPPSNPGFSSAAIDLDADEDDVQMLYCSTETRNQSTRSPPVFVIIDEDVEITPAPPVYDVEEPATALTLGTHDRHETISAHNTANILYLLSKGKGVVKPTIPEPLPAVTAVPKELTFSCPVCMNELVDPCSTKCGHIFCKECIRASIQAQKKCPTCRQKLTMNNFHRVYLPTAELRGD